MNLVTFNRPRLYSAFNDFDRVFDQFFSSPVRSNDFNVEENEEGFFFALDVPGMKKEDLKIDVKGNQLLLSGERKRAGREISFRRAFTLPPTVDVERIEAHYQDGVLELLLPKIEAVKPRSIEVQSGKEGFFKRLLASKDSSPS